MKVWKMTKKVNPDFNDIDFYEKFLGQKVEKKSGRPFKSALKINTATALCCDLIVKRLCFVFEEDESYVECFRCRVVKES